MLSIENFCAHTWWSNYEIWKFWLFPVWIVCNGEVFQLRIHCEVGKCCESLDFWPYLSSHVLAKTAEPPTTHSSQFKVSSINVLWCENGPKSRFLNHIWLSCRWSSTFSPQNLISSSLSANLPSCKFGRIHQAVFETNNVNGRHRGPKRKLRAGYIAPSLKRDVLFGIRLCDGRPSYHQQV